LGDKKNRRSSCSLLDGRTRGRDGVENVWRGSSRYNLEVEEK
jgi:hypothetical protein